MPTKYENFINTISFLCANTDNSISTVGDVFSSITGDKRIQESYKQYKESYDSIELSPDSIAYFVQSASPNAWFRYFNKRKINGDGWIDFEKEISTVIAMIENIFTFITSDYDMDINPEVPDVPTAIEPDIKAILEAFDLGNYRIDKVKNTKNNQYYLSFDSDDSPFYFSDRFQSPNPNDPSISEFDCEKLVSEFCSSLRDLSSLLAKYLSVFVDQPFALSVELGLVEPDKIFRSPVMVFSLNYTETFESLYIRNKNINNTNAVVHHIHGKTKTNIVLGVPSNKTDELNKINTRYLGFKKYFQRVVYHTDQSYMSCLEELRFIKEETEESLDVFVYGHSLDVTDKDIIKELFDLANKIVVYYYNQVELERYVSRLVSIYGKNRFDRFRTNKKMSFLPSDKLNENWESAVSSPF